METLNPNSPQILREEILADARRESEEIVRRAQQEAELLLAQAAAEAEQVRQERLEQARAEAARQIELTMAVVPMEAGRLRSARVEALLQSVRGEVLRRLLAREGYDYQEAIIMLAIGAVSQMVGHEFVVKLSPADQASFGEELLGQVARRVGRSPLSITLSAEPALDGGGVIIQDVEGRQVWDNRFAAKLERLWPGLRRHVAVQTGLVIRSGSQGGSG